MGGSGALKNKTRKITESTYHALAKAARCSKLISIIEHFRLNADLTGIKKKEKKNTQPAAIHHKEEILHLMGRNDNILVQQSHKFNASASGILNS